MANPIRGVAASERAAVHTIRRKLDWGEPIHSMNTTTPKTAETIAPMENRGSGNHTDKILFKFRLVPRNQSESTGEYPYVLNDPFYIVLLYTPLALIPDFIL